MLERKMRSNEWERGDSNNWITLNRRDLGLPTV